MTWLKLLPGKAIAVVATVLLLMTLAAGSAWRWQANSYGKQLADQAAAYEKEKLKQLEADAATQRKQQAERLALETRLAELDQSFTEKLSNGQEENERLRRMYGAADDERRRLRIEVRVARSDATVSSATGSSGLGDAASVELSAEAGSAVWDIRGMMKEDQAKIAYLQGYICENLPEAPACRKGN